MDKITKDIIKKIVIEINKEDNILQLENEIFAPVLKKFTKKIYPYVSLLFVMYSLNLLLIIIILIILTCKTM